MSDHVTLHTCAHHGKVLIHTEIEVPAEEGEYVVTIALVPESRPAGYTLAQLYGVLAATPMPEREPSPLPEVRDLLDE